MITPAVQQVTTRSKAKQDAWVEQDAVRLQTKEWVEEANARQAVEIPEKEGAAADLSDLAGCQITMTLEQLLRLVPRFRDGLTKSLHPAQVVELQVASAEMGANVIDPHCPGVDILVHGQKITGALIDGGSGVNVITTETCQQLGLTDWPKCPFSLRMGGDSSVKPEGLLQNITIMIEGHSFQISAVVLKVPSPTPYPFLLGRPWLRTTRIKQNLQRNVISFRRGGKKIKVRTTQSKAPASPLLPVCAESVNMLEGLTEEEAERYFLS